MILHFIVSDFQHENWHLFSEYCTLLARPSVYIVESLGQTATGCPSEAARAYDFDHQTLISTFTL